ncbi:LysR family transcriptional regulator [Thalassotalea fonticola]|uniref:HTH-type transcriptional regulator MetR n=1 Tax=Thalassotalea fonticola TaxID=3065649 RepID=A0ABZ0GLF6_9GAMM|nr:LysR family transcriptional regulator [Colwelliaceae bacterium S1-1]
MIERHHLEIIRAVNQQGTLTEAANFLYLSQSALSHSIKKLEQKLAVQLWIKDGRKLQLTESGRRILNLANRLLPQFEHAELEIQDIAAGQRGTLRIGMECSPCFQWLLKVVAPFLKQYPDVDVDIRKEFQFGGLGALLSYDIDLLITPDPLHKSGLQYIPVFEYEQVLVVSNQHRLANQQWINVNDLADETLLTYPIEISRLDIFNEFITPAGASIKKHKTIENTEIMLQMVNANRGVAALPLWLVNEFQQQMPIKAVRLGKSGVHKCIYVGLRSSEQRPAYLEQLIHLAKTSGK